MLRYKIDVVKALDKAGYYPRKIRDNRLLSESTLTYMRHGIMISLASLDIICRLLNKQPGDIIEYVPDDF